MGLSPSLPEAARLALVHLVDGRGGGEQGVVRGVEGGRAAVPRVHRQGAGALLQSLNTEGPGGESHGSLCAQHQSNGGHVVTNSSSGIIGDSGWALWACPVHARFSGFSQHFSIKAI